MREYPEIEVNVPSTIDYDRLFNKIPLFLKTPTPKSIVKLQQSIYLFLSYLYPSDKYMRKYISKNYWKPINISDFRKISYDLNGNVIKILTDEEYPIIEINKSYQVGVSAKKYRLKDEFWNSNLPPKIINIKSLISKKYLEIITPKPIINNEGELNNFEYLIRNYCGSVITIDPKVHDFINLYDKKLKECLIRIKGKQKKIFFLRKINNTISKMNNTVKNIENGIFNQKMNISNKRLYSELSNCKKELRKYILINGNKNIYEIDIKSSHLYILSTIINNEFLNNKTNKFSLYNIDNYLYNKLNTSFNKTNKYINLIYNKNKNKSIDININKGSLILYMLRTLENKDVQDFKSLPFRDGIYEFLDQRLFEGKEGRDYIKDKIMLFLNMIKYRYSNKLVREMSKNFPTINDIISVFNGVGNGGVNLSKFLQKVESFLLLEVGVRNVLRELPNLNFITIHDSIIVEEQYAERVKELLYDSITTMTGIPIGLDVKQSVNPINDIDKSVVDTLKRVQKSYNKCREEIRRNRKRITSTN